MATINPFQPPINYAVDVQSPFEAALGGFKLGAGVAEIQAAKQAREKAQATQTELANLFKNPLATAADYDRVAAFLPKDQAAIVTQGFERKTKEQQANDLRMGAEVYSAIKSGNLPVAKQMLTDQATAFRNSGREDKAKAIEDSIKIIDLNPTGAQATIGLYMARLPGGTDFLNNADKALSIIRTEALAKPTLDKAVADASAAVADAKKKVAEAEDTPSRLLAEADLRSAQTAQQRALTAASEGEEARKLTKFAPELRETIAKADAAVADAEKRVAEAKDTPTRLAAEQDLRVAQTARETALTAASVGGEARAVVKAPIELIEAKAKADKAIADAITAQATATNAPEKAAADAALTRAQADKAKVVAEFARADAVLEAQGKAATIKKTEADILINKENARIAALKVAQDKETNILRRQELQQKIDEAKEKRNTADREQKATFSSQIADIDNFLNTAERIIQTPKNIIESATGPIASRLPTTSADVADFESLVETLGSQVFIAQIPKIKGTGALSEKEGDKLQASVQNLSLKQSPVRLIENVKEAVRLMEKARINLGSRAGIPAMPLDVPARQEVTVTLPNGSTMKFPNQAGADAFKRAAGIM